MKIIELNKTVVTVILNHNMQKARNNIYKYSKY